MNANFLNSFPHLYRLFTSLWELPINTVWLYRQSCKGWNSQVCQKFHRTIFYFWCVDQWRCKKNACYESSSLYKWENSDYCIYNLFLKALRFEIEGRARCGALLVLATLQALDAVQLNYMRVQKKSPLQIKLTLLLWASYLISRYQSLLLTTMRSSIQSSVL